MRSSDSSSEGWSSDLEVGPALPPGCNALDDHVATPDELTRRLLQIAVTEKDEGQPLAVGQRLVTLEGKLRRWDGYIATEGGAAAAERLIRLNRLEAIEDLRPKSADQVETADASLTAAGKAAQQAGEQMATNRTNTEEHTSELQS